MIYTRKYAVLYVAYHPLEYRVRSRLEYSPPYPIMFPSVTTVNATRGEEMHVEEFYSNVTSFSVRRYDRYTRYRFSLAAKTQVGLGEWHTEESAHYTTEGGCSVLYPEYNSARTSECIMGRWSAMLCHKILNESKPKLMKT